MEPRRERWYRRLLGVILPPPQWQLAVIVSIGILSGLAILLFHVSRASSYLSDAPETCINCHVMAPHYVTWSRSAHREVATCNDCHVPQDNIFRHYAFKASDGLYHSTVFTLRIEPQVIRIRQPGMKVVQENCVRCHYDVVHEVGLQRVAGNDLQREDGLRCVDCHRATPHGEINSLSAVPYENVPLPGRAIPDWMRGWLDRSPSNSPTSD